MDFQNAIKELRLGESWALREIYFYFRTSFVSWMNSAHKKDARLAIETYKYAIASLYEATIQNETSFNKENDVRVYLFSVAKNRLLLEKKVGMHLSYQADLEEEALEENDQKKIRIDKLKKLVAIQGYPCKELLEYHYFNQMPPELIADKLDYKRSEAIDELKSKCIERIKKLLSVANEEI